MKKWTTPLMMMKWTKSTSNLNNLALVGSNKNKMGPIIEGGLLTLKLRMKLQTQFMDGQSPMQISLRGS